MAKKNRRSFLKNVSLSTLGLGLVGKSSATSIVSAAENKSLIACNKTTLDFYGAGPFYTDNPPFLKNNVLASDREVGERMIISGRILNLECNEFIPDTIVDVWHANDAGAYDNDAFNLRGYVKSNEQGFYLFETIKPGKYLNGQSFRPSHIQFKVKPPNFPLLTTQLYFEGDDRIPGDAAASITSGNFNASNRIISLTKNSDNVLEGTFDIIIDGEGMTVGVNDLHIDKGMVYKVSSNPVMDELEIHYGVFKHARVGIKIFDISGKLVSVLEDSEKTPEKYFAYWRPETNTPSGHYFVSLSVNDLQVHYQKVFKA
jgi:protocatechuate 3,4-dioxygenase beta subunit